MSVYDDILAHVAKIRQLKEDSSGGGNGNDSVGWYEAAKAWERVADELAERDVERLLSVLDKSDDVMIRLVRKNGKIVQLWCRADTVNGDPVTGSSSTSLINAIRDCVGKLEGIY